MSGGMAASYMLAARKSAYHENCQPRPQNNMSTQANLGGPSGTGDAASKKCDAVTKDTIWKQSVAAERRCLQNWGDDWGFLTEFDSKGQPIEKEELPEKAVVFSDAVPNTNSGNYGSRLKTEPARTMQNLEFQFFSEGRRQKLDSEMVCY